MEEQKNNSNEISTEEIEKNNTDEMGAEEQKKKVIDRDKMLAKLRISFGAIPIFTSFFSIIGSNIGVFVGVLESWNQKDLKLISSLKCVGKHLLKGLIVGSIIGSEFGLLISSLVNANYYVNENC